MTGGTVHVRRDGGTSLRAATRPTDLVRAGTAILVWILVVSVGLLLTGSRADTVAETVADRAIVRDGTGVPHAIASVLAELFSPVGGVLAILFVAAAVVVVRQQVGAGVRYAVVVAVPWLSTEVVKLLVDRARPDLGAGFPTSPPDSGSFPSGHTALAVALALGAVWLAGRRYRVVVGLLALSGAAAVGVSRLVLGVHYPTDVVASFVATGAVFVVVVTALGVVDRARGTRGRRDDAIGSSARGGHDGAVGSRSRGGVRP